MSDQDTSTPADITRVTPTSGAVTGSVLAEGDTTVTDGVIAKVAGLAVRDVPGVHALGGGAARVIGQLRDRIGQTDLTQGIAVDVQEAGVAFEVTLVAEYGVPLHDISADVRAAISEAVTQLVGRPVTRVDVTIADIVLPGEGSDADAEAPAA
ncbi:Asp23/Gls24 family envelope stress response protein [Clavibacter sp. VKM Ac-2873]|uniref:Asp23/Gls24 family envelope stress response protein n=1 Tax=Clavibacter sp. VKM Ac-2873 TaxID=2783813 RepID=UPI00188D20D8|nr:Asp23/Gls24 family envelope stress response protein [Clavibacter sp. VKM Ac-2873]MBF4617840.1 Asp23/Gls24 family envelope stress response protein [Clavibacter sp. VKM Ac-2873]